MISLIIEGKVIKGDGYGRKIGFPTANLDHKQYVKDKVDLPLGIYAGIVYLHHSKKILKTAIIVGPLNKKGIPKIEAHILKFKGRIYGKKLTLTPYKFLRPFETFKTEKMLIAQIKKDIKRVEREIATPVSFK
jgi:FAD synthase